MAYVWPVRDWRSWRTRSPRSSRARNPRRWASFSSVGFSRLLFLPALRSRKAERNRNQSECTCQRVGTQRRWEYIPASLPVARPPRRELLLFSRGWEGASLGASRLPTRGAGLSTAFVGGSGALLGSSSGSLPVVAQREQKHARG